MQNQPNIKIYLLIITALLYGTGCAQMFKPIRATSGKTNLEKLLNEKEWNELFPNRYGKGETESPKIKGDFYSFKALVAAAKAFPEFLAEGDELTQKRELAAFLANIAQETTGGWNEAPGGYFKWGLCYLQEQGHPNPAYISTGLYPAVKGQKYYGRGPKQLSWNYNYAQFSQMWFGSPDTLLQNPDYLIHDPVVSFASAIWFWMTPQAAKPSCHDVMSGKWKPSQDDINAGRQPGFGTTLNIINGGQECGKTIELAKTKYRYEYYKYFCKFFKISTGPNVECSDQKPFK